MIIRYKESFKNRFNRQLQYIAQDSPSCARRFRDALRQHISTLKENPYRCRKSIYFDDDSIRDLIFKGYVIVYKISDQSIDVFGLTKYQATATDENNE